VLKVYNFPEENICILFSSFMLCAIFVSKFLWPCDSNVNYC